MKTYAYMPERDENTTAAFIKIGILAGNIYTDTGESENTRPAYVKLLKLLKKGDTLYIKNLESLGFNMQEILCQWRTLTKEMGIDIAVMSNPLLDTRIGKELSGSLVADVIAEVLSYAVLHEREKRRKIQRKGIDRALENGIHFGRVEKPLPENFEALYRQWKNGSISGREAARRCNMPPSTFRIRVKIYDAEKQKQEQ